MVELVRSGRTLDGLAREFEPSAQQPVVKVPAAFEQRCIPPDCVVRRLRMSNMHSSQAIRDWVAQASLDAGLHR